MMELVEIHWWDTQDADKDKTWLSTDEVEEFASTQCDIYSVGWIVKKTRHYVTICSDFSPDPDTHGRVTKIPRKMIRGMTPLKHKSPAGS